MARKKLKDIKFPDLPDTYYVPEIDDTLSVEGATADAKAVGDALDLKPDKTELEEAIADLDERKAEIDGYYETLTSGQTEQIIATEAVTDTEPYIYRKTGGPNDVGDRVYDEIVGGSVVWNQLVNSGDTEVTVPNGHKYYANINGTKSIGASTGTAISINDSTKDNIIDLTALLTPVVADHIYTLEQANAGAGVAYFKKYFPEEYHEFCEPHFEHVQTSQKVTVGFNRLPQNLKKASSTPTFDENKAVRVVNGQQYQLTHGQVKNATSWRHAVYCFDLDGKPLFTKEDITSNVSGGMGYNTAGSYYVNSSNGTRTAEKFTVNFDGYIQCYIAVGDTTLSTEALESCLHLTGDRDGEYEPYRKRTYPLDSSLTLRGIPKLDSANRLYFDGDVYRHDGSGEYRYDLVDLGTLTYTYTSGVFRFTLSAIGAKAPSNAYVYPNALCQKYTSVPSSVEDFNGSFKFHPTSGYGYIADSSYTDAASFKTAMSGVYLLYEKATPEPFTAEPFQSPMVVDPLGTEAFIDYGVEQADRDVAIPVGHNSEYPADLRGKLQHLPSLASADGRYVVVQTGNQMSLTPDTSLGLIAALEARVAALEGGNG